MAGFSFDNVLFLCVANSARSQMAEGLARQLFGAGVKVQSAGSTPGSLHPLAVKAMGELDIDIAAQAPKGIDAVELAGVNLVVTLCGEELCPPALSEAKRFKWALADPAEVADGEAEEDQLERFRAARDDIKARLELLAAAVAPA